MKHLKKLFVFIALASLLWAAGRFYFYLTDGFTIENITSSNPFDPRWKTNELSDEERRELDTVLSQTFHYLGKGCQSYVFESDDGLYVLKFFKYQRYRPSKIQEMLSGIEWFDELRQKRMAHKKEKLDSLFSSTCLAFNRLKDETGLVFVHLNKTDDLKKKVTLFDKMGFVHEVNLDDMEFMVQKKAEMLCEKIDCLVTNHEEEKAKLLLSQIVQMVLQEYEQGLADNDHALMQNTAVLHEKPIHIDTGQFVEDETMKSLERRNQELFNKTYKFRLWLKKQHPALNEHLTNELRALMGSSFDTIVYIPSR